MGAAYAPYSGFSVGCALRTKSNQIFVGCNVENASLGATLCAERSAVAAAVAAADRDIVEVMVVTTASKPVSPCGICRQFLFEFGREIRIHAGTAGGGADSIVSFTIEELLPAAPNENIEWA